MARIFITGSADGLGHLAAKQLVSEGHRVVLHARNRARGVEALKNIPGAETVLTADLSNMDETKQLAAEANTLGSFDAVIHNAGVYQVPGSMIFAVNSLAPYVLTCRMHRPKRLIYMSSGMHMHGKSDLAKLDMSRLTYSDSKLHNVILTMAVARNWPDVFANAVNPGWVPTKMGGAGAPDSLEEGLRTQVWLAASDELEAKVSGKYFYHRRQKHYRPDADNVDTQEKFLDLCEQHSGVRFPVD